MNGTPLTVLEFGNFRVDARKRVLRRMDGEQIPLTPKLFDTLQYLVEHAGAVLEKDELMSAIWPGIIVEENNLSQAISSLRRVLGDDGEEHRYIVTVPRRGYRFVADVRQLSEPPVPLAKIDTPTVSPAPERAKGAGIGGESVETVPSEQFAEIGKPAAPARPGAVRSLRRTAIIAIAALFVAFIGAVLWRLQMPRPETAGAKSIAVLPFTNPGGNKDDEFFGEGITDDMVTQLSQISDLRVISRTSTMRYRGTTKNLRDIARELGVAYILVGSVRRGDQRFRINAQLVDAERDENLWARTYDRDNKDILAVQSEVTTEIATSLKASLLVAEKVLLGKRARGNPDAYVLYLQGMYELRTRIVNGRDEYEAAPSFFRKAIALDPASPLGYVGMATYHINRARLGFVSAGESYANAEQFLLKALALDAQSADVYIKLAELRGPAKWDWPGAEKAAKRAIELNPGSAQTWDVYRRAYLEPTGRLGEALAAQQRAVLLDPFNAAISWRLAVLHSYAGNCNEAMRLARISIGLDPTFTIHHTVMVNCLERQGKFREAIAENRLVKGYWLTDMFLDEQEKAYATQGEAGYRRVRYLHQKQLALTRNDAWFFAASAAVMVGEMGDAFRCLDLAIKAVDRNVIYLKVDPDFDSVRGDPRYLAALKRLHLD